MSLILIKCGNKSYACEESIDVLRKELEEDTLLFITVSECYWKMEALGEFVSKRKETMIRK